MRVIQIDGARRWELCGTTPPPPVPEFSFHALLVGLVEVWREHGLSAVSAAAADQIHTIDAALT